MNDDSACSKRALDTRLFAEWPAELVSYFDGTGLAAKAGFTASLVVVDARAGGHAQTSLLSVGELYVPDARTLAFVLWPAARAARALRDAAAKRCARAVLTFVHDAAFYQVQLNVDVLPDEGLADQGEQGGLARFVASVESMERQRVPYAELTSGIAFELSHDQRADVLERWERQIESLRRAVLART
ncbi:hypothetical protein LJR230_003346 [Trinickia sp. LjRoot230]|uniref:hypothetical protein n=1 Tax=Trinickia sp. LjRoot230 TaxID=3342288 RepID=UPI003ECF5255